MLDISEYMPGRFAYLMREPFVCELWAFLSSEESLTHMLFATRDSKAAITPLLEEIEKRFGLYITSPDFPGEDVEVLVNNMVKQLMERQGYEHVACGLCRGKHIKTSGVYGRKSADR